MSISCTECLTPTPTATAQTTEVQTVMRYDPRKHHRRSIRMRGYDYTQPGAYFVTICTHNRECLFDDPVLRRVVETHWRGIPRHAPHVTLDARVVMPNHVHGIIVIGGDHVVGTRHSPDGIHQVGHLSPDAVLPPLPHLTRNALSLQNPGNVTPQRPRERPHGVTPGSLSAIVGNIKSVTTRRINRIHHTPGQRVWQRDYYERIVRDERALMRIRQYIHDNPARWREDIENLTTRPAPTLKQTAAYYGSIWDEEI